MTESFANDHTFGAAAAVVSPKHEDNVLRSTGVAFGSDGFRSQVRLHRWWLAVIVGLLGVFVVGHRVVTDYASGVLDLYPVYWGGRAWLGGGNAYDLTAVQPYLAGQLKLLSDVGNVYPMPATLLFLPLALLPPKVASCVYLAGVIGALVVMIRATKSSPALLMYAPIVVAIATEQLTALVLIAQMMALVGIRTGRKWLTAISFVLCAIKPSQTLLFIALLLWQDRKNVRTHLGLLGGVFVASLVAQPDWPVRWIHLALARNDFFPGAIHWLWWAAPLGLLAWHWGDRVGAVNIVQFAIVPMPLKVYAFAPLAIDASFGSRIWVLVVGQGAALLLWHTSPELAVGAGLFIPRVLVAAPLPRLAQWMGMPSADRISRSSPQGQRL